MNGMGLRALQEAVTTTSSGSSAQVDLLMFVDYLASKFKGSGTVYGPAEVAAGLDRPTEVVMGLAGMLCSESMNLLVPHWTIYDEAGDRFLPVDAEDALDALADGVALHPHTAEPISPARDFVFFHYEPSARFERLYRSMEENDE